LARSAPRRRCGTSAPNYGFLGDWAEGIASGVPRTPEAVRRTATAFEDLGVDELIFDPSVADLDQIDRLAEVVPPS
jgi:hypothetical protein